MGKWIQGLIIALLAIFVTGTFAFAGGGASPQPQESTEEPTGQGWLGISVVNIGERVVDHFGLTVDSGVAIVHVAADGPGGTAGLQAGDVVQAIDGQQVTAVEQLGDIIRAIAPGTTVTVTILRDGTALDISVVVGQRPQRRVYESPVPGYALRLITPGLLRSLVHADYQLIGEDGEVINVGLTLGDVVVTTDSGLLTITRKDGVGVQFQTAMDTLIAIGRHPINLEGFIEGTQVLVVERDGDVVAVVGGLGELVKHSKPKHYKVWPNHRVAGNTPAYALPQQEQLRGLLRDVGPGPELRKNMRRLGPEMRERVKEFESFFRNPFPEYDSPRIAPESFEAIDQGMATA